MDKLNEILGKCNQNNIAFEEHIVDLEKMREEVINRTETCLGKGEEGNILEKVRNFNYDLHKNRVKKYLLKATIVRVVKRNILKLLKEIKESITDIDQTEYENMKKLKKEMQQIEDNVSSKENLLVKNNRLAIEWQLLVIFEEEEEEK